MNIPKKDFIQILNGDKNTIEKYKNKVIPQKKCAYCGTEFIPSNRSDEIYCKKCRDIPYDVKSLSNGDLRRREYKKMYARMMRGLITKDDLDSHMKQYDKELKVEVE